MATQETHVCEASGYIEGQNGAARDVLVTLIRAGESRNGYVYASEVLQEAIPLFEGATAFCDHVPGPPIPPSLGGEGGPIPPFGGRGGKSVGPQNRQAGEEQVAQFAPEERGFPLQLQVVGEFTVCLFA